MTTTTEMSEPTKTTEAGWGGWTLRRRLRVALAALSVLLLVAGLAVVSVLRQADDALRYQSERALPARVAASRLMTSLVDQETGLRGFALTGDEVFLTPYRQGLLDEEQARAQLERDIPPGDSVRLALITTDAAITAWRDQYASLRTAATTPSTPGTQRIGTDQTLDFGRVLFDRLRLANAALDGQLARQAGAARAEADRDRRVVVVVLALMAILVAGAVLVLQRALQTAVLRPMSRLASQVDEVAGGAHGSPIEPDGPPDLRAMGSAVESMRLELVGVLAEVEHQQRDLERRAADLARSNSDLEQFAYVASHDLQEPLRKVASFCQLLEQRYGGQLDEQADQYIAFAVDGAKRMQRLISDLLTFSRVGRSSAGFVGVDLRDAVGQVWEGLSAPVEATAAQLEVDVSDEAAEVLGDRSLLHQLLSNLVGNAIKYRRDDVAPRVRVTARVDGRSVRVQVADNGIGIPAEYADKVFMIFQRLHGRDEYEGTGIGLALAKKIVEFHGGTIAVVSSPLGGACLSFTLPLQHEAAFARA